MHTAFPYRIIRISLDNGMWRTLAAQMLRKHQPHARSPIERSPFLNYRQSSFVVSCLKRMAIEFYCFQRPLTQKFISFSLCAMVTGIGQRRLSRRSEFQFSNAGPLFVVTKTATWSQLKFSDSWKERECMSAKSGRS